MRTFAVKVQHGNAVIYDARTGAQLRTIGNQVVSAQMLGDLVQVTTASGRVEIWSAETGARQRTL